MDNEQQSGKLAAWSTRHPRHSRHCCTAHPACSFCGRATLHDLVGTVENFGNLYSVLFCRSCGIGMTWPRPDLATLERLYAPGEYRFEGGKRFIAPVEWLFEWYKKRSVSALCGGLNGGSMLDVGCGSGYTANLCARSGWKVTGVEFSNDTAGHARETYGINVVTELSQLHEQFDLIIINHVLEHCFEPQRLLRECRSLLAPGGRLVVAVPNFASIQARYGKKLWFHLDLPTHLFHFTEEGLARLLVKSGFLIIAKSHSDWAHNFYGWLQTMLNRAGLRHNALYDFLRRKGKQAACCSAPEILSLSLATAAVPAALIGLLAEKLFKTGGVIRFIAAAAPYKPQSEDTCGA